MPHESRFAFAGSGLDRATALRTAPEMLAGHLAGPGAQVLPVWRGKPLFGAAGALAWLEPTHPALRSATEPPVFLGRDGATHYFTQDISSWQPDGPAPDPGQFLDLTEQSHPALPRGTVFAELRGRMGGLDARDAELAAMARGVLLWHRSHRFCAACGVQSRPAQAGWQRLCPACGAAHFPRTDPVVIMLVTRANSVLIGRSPGWPEGMYSCLAGFMEPGETLEAAVRREVAEETGVVVGRVGYVASQPWPFPASLMLGARAEALSEAILPDPAEIEDARWISREELAQVFAGRHAVIRPPRRGAIAAFLMGLWLADRLQ